MLLPAKLLSTWLASSPDTLAESRSKVLVRIPLSTWYCTAKFCTSLRIFHSPLDHATRPPVIDATWGTSVVAATPVLRADETIQAAELFCGGFCGWSQSLRIFQKLQCNVCTRWMLDCNADCFDSAKFVHGGLQLVHNEVSLKRAVRDHELPFFIQGDICDTWWHHVFEGSAAHLWCASPPCPPWSQASTGPGLACPDGQLVLLLAAMMQALQPVCVCIEQVPGFQAHSHYDFVQSRFAEAGFTRIWHDVVDLGDFLPTFRRRYLAVWVRNDAVTRVPSTSHAPLPVKPSLGASRCMVQLPPAMLRPCLLAPETLSLYLDPRLLPPPVRQKKQPAAAYRVKSSSQCASTIMASYHSQHELPAPLLQSKRLLGCLVQGSEGLRFFSGLEAALCHGCRCFCMHLTKCKCAFRGIASPSFKQLSALPEGSTRY